ncbi:MAG: AMP-binding protein [Pseudomonadota bacterium]
MSTVTVYQTFVETAERYPQHDFLHIPASACQQYSDSAITLSYHQAMQAVDGLRSAYQRAGFGSGHRVALMLQNRPEFLLHWFALNALGCSVVPVNDEMAPQEQAYIVEHSESILLVHLPDLADKVTALSTQLTASIDTYCTTNGSPPTVSIGSDGETAGSDSECAILYTSGSTGKPKGCILTNEYYLLSGRRYLELGGLCALEPGVERLATPLPLVHMNAMACSTLAMVMLGGCLIQLDRFHPQTWWQSIRESRASVVHYLGVMPAMLLSMDPLANNGDDFSEQIKFGFGAGVNPKHHAAFEHRFGFPLVEGWAMTETGCNGAIMANQEPRHVGTCCFGLAPAHLELRLIDETGVDVASGEPGELLLRHVGEHPQRGFFSGYLKNPEATEEVWQGGWFHTGDVVRRDESDALYFVDRRKNVIRRSGENISALEVEAALASNPAINMAVVCPVPDEVRGDEVMACVIPAPDTTADQQSAERIVQAALASLVYFKVPGYVAFMDSLPLTASEKPKRGDIKTLARSLLENGQCFDTRHLKKRRKSA